jgi:cobalt/nickel transport system ATP-binding protein
VVTHDLPYALQLCPRSVLLDGGRVVADGPTRELLADADLMRSHRLELPYGFDPLSVPGAAAAPVVPAPRPR